MRRHADGERNLTKLCEARVLDVAVVGAQQTGDVTRLLVERRGLVVRGERVAEAHIAEPIGEVEQLLTTAMIEERADGEVLEQRKLRRERDFARRERGAEELGAVPERDLTP